MAVQKIEKLFEGLRAALDRQDIEAAVHLLEGLRAPDQAEIISDLDKEEEVALLLKLDPAMSADILEKLEDEEVAELVTSMPSDGAIPIYREMEADEIADLLGDVSPEQAQEILRELENPEEVRPLLLHPDDSAGGLMTSEFLALRRRMTAMDAITAIRQWQPDSESAYYLFVIDEAGKLCGVVSLRQLIVAAPEQQLAEIMNTEVISVPMGTDQEECARLIARYDLLALPVVDDNQTLVGVITVDDVIDVLEDEATEDIQRFGGAQPLEEAYLNSKIFTVTRKRVGWLMLLFVTGSLTGTVLRYFQEELTTVVALAIFVPLLIGTGGNAGSQTTSTIIRALAVGDIDLGDALRSLWHELQVGSMLGLAMAGIGYVRAMLWGTTPGLAGTVALALLTIVVWANALGALLPLLAARLKIDPTVVSGPVMSTLVDATGLFIYFTIARLMLGI